jgi:hypothetical protein
VIDDNTIKASINFAKIDKLNQLKPLTLAWMLTIIQCRLGLALNPSFLFAIIFFCFSPYLLLLLFLPFGIKVAPSLKDTYFYLALIQNFSPFGIKSPKKAWQTKIAQREKLVA